MSKLSIEDRQQAATDQTYVPEDKSVFTSLKFDSSVPEQEYSAVSKKLTEQILEMGLIFGR